MKHTAQFYTFLVKMRSIVAVFVFLSIVTAVFLYRSTIPEIFDYKAIYKEVWLNIKSSFELKRNTADAVVIPMPEVDLVPKVQAEETATENAPANAGNLTVPKLNISAPLISAQNSDNAYIQNLLKQGVVVYPTSSMPGKPGASIILGHSAPPGWPKISYDWIFSSLNNLQPGDMIQVTSREEEYRYAVTKKFFLNRGEDMAISNTTSSISTLLLITCWPPGIDKKRIVIQAELL